MSLRLRLTIPTPCRYCGSERRVRGSIRLCDACRREYRPTPLDRWLESRQMTLVELARKASIARSTLQLLAAGEHVSDLTIAAVAEVTGLAPEKLVDPYRKNTE